MTTTPLIDPRHVITRREWLTTLGGGLAALIAGPELAHATTLTAPRAMTVYKSPSCECCRRWVDLARAAGYTMTVRNTDDIESIKRRLKIPEALWSCHTAIVGGYHIEGHVPLDLVAKLLRERPKGSGLAVPGMPAGSPGMEVPGTEDRYDVLLFRAGGRSAVYARR